MADMADEKWPHTEEEMLAQIHKAMSGHDSWEGEDGYNRCPEAMARAALAAFRYAGHVLGVTGFQASCADLVFLRASRRLKGPFGIVDGEQILYPQYDLRAKVDEWIRGWMPTLAKRAADLLATTDHAHPGVRAHWAKLAARESAETEREP